MPFLDSPTFHLHPQPILQPIIHSNNKTLYTFQCHNHTNNWIPTDNPSHLHTIPVSYLHQILLQHLHLLLSTHTHKTPKNRNMVHNSTPSNPIAVSPSPKSHFVATLSDSTVFARSLTNCNLYTIGLLLLLPKTYDVSWDSLAFTKTSSPTTHKTPLP